MNDFRIEFDSNGFKQILNSAGVEHELAVQAEKIRQRAQANAPKSAFSTSTWSGNYGGGRKLASVTSAGASVYTEDSASAIEEINTKALQKAVR